MHNHLQASISLSERKGQLLLKLSLAKAGCQQHTWARLILTSDCAIQVKGTNDDINVKRLPKKAAPQRFGRKLTASQRELATHICIVRPSTQTQLEAHKPLQHVVQH